MNINHTNAMLIALLLIILYCSDICPIWTNVGRQQSKVIAWPGLPSFDKAEGELINEGGGRTSLKIYCHSRTVKKKNF